ncbi:MULTISPECIES: hypothetical protein [unclassified Arthrobacter]|uniref:MmyB family transcriptional regulator n=1 Tax=unclassified Arthrobacter TaxID=235627 RepID=UPI00211DD925|nr:MULTISPECIES: hypothetical protein [unclassified Arthrobacter]
MVAGKRHLHHALVGDIELFHEKLAFAGTDEHLLVIHHAEPGSPSELALQWLAATLP